jgi:hypothetical protein
MLPAAWWPVTEKERNNDQGEKARERFHRRGPKKKKQQSRGEQKSPSSSSVFLPLSSIFFDSEILQNRFFTANLTYTIRAPF